jgi:transcriptional regulator with XRE-family HTH domain
MIESLGENIKSAREASGLTQAELGKLIGVTGVAIMRYEKGLREPKLETLQKIASALKVDIYSLADFDTATQLLNEHINEQIEKDPQPTQGRSEVTDEDIKFALFDGNKEITDEMYEEVKRFAKYVQQRNNGG